MGGGDFSVFGDMPEDLLALHLDADVERDTDRAILTLCREVTAACRDRDDDLYYLRQKLEGVSQPGGYGPWPNSCIIEDPAPREFHTTAHANIASAFRQKPWATLQGLDPQYDAVVANLETMMNTEAELFGFGPYLDALTYIALESRFAVGRITYGTTASKHKEVIPDPTLHMEDQSVPSIDAKTDILTQKNETTENFDFTALDSWDFYLDPVGHNDEQTADHTIERIWLTKSALWEGIDRENFDETAVKKLIVAGPTAELDGTAPKREQMEYQGIQEMRPQYYECYRVIGKMPQMFDHTGAPKIPEQYLGEDFLWLVCPAHNIVFKRTYSPYPVRPYAMGKALGPENEMIGHGIVSILSAIADELTIIDRAAIDSVNATMDPQMKVPEHLQGYYSSKDNRRPGSILPYRGNDPNSVQAVTRDFAGLQIGIEMANIWYGRCAQLAAAQGVNSLLSGKVRKAAEVDFTAEVIQNKFGLMLANIQKIVEKSFRVYFALRRNHLRDTLDVRVGDTMASLTKEDLSVPFRIIPHADADNASSQLRLQTDEAIGALLGSSPLYQSYMQMGDFSYEWMRLKTMLSHLGIRNPESLIGPQPQMFDAMAIIQMILPIVMQGAQAQDPVAMQIIQAVQQRQQMAEMSGQLMLGGQQMPQLNPGTGLTLSAMPSSPGQQAAMNGAGVGIQ